MARDVEALESELTRLRAENARLVAEVQRLNTALAQALERLQKLEQRKKQTPE